MLIGIKSQQAILDKLGIEELNPMQEETLQAIELQPEVILLSPTGTGKTLAFLLPIINRLDSDCKDIQVLVIVPSRELAIQIEQVVRSIGAGYKVNAVYGGRSGIKDKIDLKHPPSILIGTPGRIADHLRRKTFSSHKINTLVLDEFDKSLEIGFEGEMREIITALPSLDKKVLTSATQRVKVPAFVGMYKPNYINYLTENTQLLTVKTIPSPTKDKMDALAASLENLKGQPGIVFCNFKESIQQVSDYLNNNNISHGCFYGGMEQKDRERALIKFRNGTHQLLIATDLAARGIDVPEIKFIIHYHLPIKSEEFTHRNGRTARMHNEGTAYVLHWENEKLPDFIRSSGIETFESTSSLSTLKWQTLFISGGRKDKISKGDIAGLFIKQGNILKEQLGTIELKQDCAFVAVEASKVDQLIKLVNNTKLKKKKVRISVI